VCGGDGEGYGQNNGPKTKLLHFYHKIPFRMIPRPDAPWVIRLFYACLKNITRKIVFPSAKIHHVCFLTAVMV
jgi:hypothetical protein